MRDNTKKPSMFTNILFIFPVMGYFLLEAAIVGVIITVVWKLFLAQFFGGLGYFQIVAFYWIAKMLFFDVFKLITGLAQSPPVEEPDKNVLTEKDFR